MPTLRELVARIRSSEDPAEIDRLTGEYRRARQEADVEAITPKIRVVRADPEEDADTAAIRTWPPELRGRLGSSPFSAVIGR
jgi:hypothetical protein